MRKSYDFSKARRNPYAAKLKGQITIRFDAETLVYFGSLATETGIPHQPLSNLYLRDCVASKRRLALGWKGRRPKAA